MNNEEMKRIYENTETCSLYGRAESPQIISTRQRHFDRLNRHVSWTAINTRSPERVQSGQESLYKKK
jgi:hypothetical protein